MVWAGQSSSLHKAFLTEKRQISFLVIEAETGSAGREAESTKGKIVWGRLKNCLQKRVAHDRPKKDSTQTRVVKHRVYWSYS